MTPTMEAWSDTDVVKLWTVINVAILFACYSTSNYIQCEIYRMSAKWLLEGR